MTIYHWLIVLLLLLGLLMHGERKGNIAFILLATALLFGIMGLRDAEKIGVDSRFSYSRQFESMENAKWEDMGGIKDWMHLSNDDQNEETNDEDEDQGGRERNIALPRLMKLVYDWTDGDYQWFIAIEAAIVMVCLALFLRRFSPSPLQSVIYYLGLLYFTMEMSALKQALAMGILLLSFAAIIDRKPVRFVVLVCFASFFHFPAIVFLPAYWIGNMRMGKRYLLLLAVLFILTYLFRDRLVSLMTEVYDTEINENGSTRFLANKVVIMIVIIVTAILVRPPEPKDNVYSTLLQLIGIAAVIQTFASYNNTFERLADYYFQLAIVFIPMVFEQVKTKQKYLSDNTLNLIRIYGPYVFCAFGIWRFLDNIINDPHFSPFYFYFQ